MTEMLNGGRIFIIFVVLIVSGVETFGGSAALPVEPMPKVAAAAATKLPADDSKFFETRVQAVLKAKCARCHGEKQRKADLDLSSGSGVLTGGESGAVVVAGKPDDSPLYEMVETGTMPPDEKNPPSAAEIAIIKKWIAAGAKFRQPVASTRAVTGHQIVPLMHLRCTVCHGRRRREAGLDLRTKASMLKGGKSGPALVPGTRNGDRSIY